MSLSKKEEVKNFLESTPKYIDYFAQHSIDLSIQINKLLKKYNMTQKDLAKLVDKKESEISKWLSGNHNLTLKSIAKIEAAFNEQIIFTKDQVDEQISENIDEKLTDIFSYIESYIETTYSSRKTISLKNGRKNDLESSEIINKKNISDINSYLIIGEAA